MSNKMNGIIESLKPIQTKQGKPMTLITIDGTKFSLFGSTNLQEGDPVEIEYVINHEFKNIKKIKKQEFKPADKVTEKDINRNNYWEKREEREYLRQSEIRINSSIKTAIENYGTGNWDKDKERVFKIAAEIKEQIEKEVKEEVKKTRKLEAFV